MIKQLTSNKLNPLIFSLVNPFEMSEKVFINCFENNFFKSAVGIKYGTSKKRTRRHDKRWFRDEMKY